MVEGNDGRRMSSKQVIKVRKFAGATISDMHHCLTPLLEKTTSPCNTLCWQKWRSKL